MKNLFKQLIRFGIVGVFVFLIDYSILYILTEFLGIYYLYSSIISFIISLIFNYIASIKWVFDASKKQTLKDFTIFILLSVIGLGINQLAMYIIVEKIKIWYMFSKIVASLIVMVWNFITRKIFIEK